MDKAINPTQYTEPVPPITTDPKKLPADLALAAWTYSFNSQARKRCQFDVTVPIFGLNGEQLFKYFKEDNKRSVGFLDCRQDGNLDHQSSSTIEIADIVSQEKTQFKDACHVDTHENTIGVQPQFDRLHKFKTENPALFNALLKKDWVIIHCASGVNRSPPMTISYAEMYSQAPKNLKNPNQQIIFLKDGMGGYSRFDKEGKFCKYYLNSGILRKG